jgi:uncharacterized protein (TIGR03546 family)|tara:strand:+ start:4215 stop:4718 length:504 start_codon:yes stop_codon:yes gene_type:complete
MVFIAKLLKALSSDASPWQLALGIMFGMLVGLTPLLRLHNLIVLFIVLFFRVNLSTFLIALSLFSGLAYLLDPAMITIGESLLTHESLQSFWTALYNSDIGLLSQFFHTLTLGSFVLSVLLCPIVLFTSKILIVQYRERFMAYIEKLKIVAFLKGTKLYQLFKTLGD